MYSQRRASFTSPSDNLRSHQGKRSSSLDQRLILLLEDCVTGCCVMNVFVLFSSFSVNVLLKTISHLFTDRITFKIVYRCLLVAKTCETPVSRPLPLRYVEFDVVEQWMKRAFASRHIDALRSPYLSSSSLSLSLFLSLSL